MINEDKQNFTNDLMELLFKIYDCPLKLQSDLARSEALLVAAAASEGLISSICPVSKFPNGCWRVTPKGLNKLESY